MVALAFVAGAFAAVIAVGIAAVAVNDALERWWAQRAGGGGRAGEPAAPGYPVACGVPSPRVDLYAEPAGSRSAARGERPGRSSPLRRSEAARPGAWR
ncbi:MAG TPA: hypothetical protein VKA00_04275 [Trueperaceae bacterium]|nr:hypothetical protein [Trueperaceae bacterium]